MLHVSRIKNNTWSQSPARSENWIYVLLVAIVYALFSSYLHKMYCARFCIKQKIVILFGVLLLFYCCIRRCNFS